MEKKIFVAITGFVLVIGVLAGYCIGANCLTDALAMNAHRMPDGSIMGNGASMQGMMADMGAALEGKSGDEFDMAFLSEMIVHHEGAVDMARTALQSAKHLEIKSMANDIISAQTQEISQMRAWLKGWYNQ
ncbi:MAG TPA: DUF305 domain-containing protein [Candidatus Paceibacterota bacterium]